MNDMRGPSRAGVACISKGDPGSAKSRVEHDLGLQPGDSVDVESVFSLKILHG